MKSTVRVACLRIPRFPIGAVWRAGAGTDHPATTASAGRAPATEGRTHPPREHWDTLPLALTGPTTPDRIVVVTRHAGTLGVLAGMSVTAARAVCATLEVRPWNARAVGDAVHQVSAALLSSSPQVTAERPGIWWIGAGGLRGRDPERALARALLAIGREWHPEARVGIASSCVAAHAATWLPGDARIVPIGRDADLLAQAPLTFIPMDAEVRETLVALGLTRAGQLAALDPGDVEARFGPPGLAAWRLARGEDLRRPMLAREVPADTVELELPVPADTLEPVLFLVRAALGRLLDPVRRDGQAVAGVGIELKLDKVGEDGEDGKDGLIQVRPARALARFEPLYEQCRAALENVVLSAPVLGLVVRILERVSATSEQGDLLHTGWRDPAAAEAAFARLRATLGPDTVVRPVALDGFVPERRGRWETRGERPEARGVHAGLSPLASSLSPSWRLLNPPEAITTTASDFTWREQARRITARGGVERLSGDWWKDGYARDYACWESDGVRFLVFRSEARWYVQGWMD